MENKVINGMDYVLPEIKNEQKKIILTDVAGVHFEATFNMPTTKDVLVMEDICNDYIEKDGMLFQKTNKVKKVEWILENLLVVPAELKIEHLNKLSVLEIEESFR